MNKRTNLTIPILIAFFVFFSLKNVVAQKTYSNVVWEKGKGNYKGYRIPSMIVSKNGTVLAFAEGRNDAGDSGDIDLVLKRSTDNGKTWGNEILVWNDELNTCGNPCPVIDEQSGRIWMIMSWNDGRDKEDQIINKTSKMSRKVYSCYSDDDGLSWSKPEDITTCCKDSSWAWYATGPGFGIQLKNSKYKGRLVIPANHSYDDPESKIGKVAYGYGAHVLISDDHGKSWRKSASIRPGCNESQVTELSDGTLLMNMRSYNEESCRAISFSSDGGDSWSPVSFDYQLAESRCQASILDFGTVKGKHIYLFSNPAVVAKRTHMTIKYSDNDCRDWKGSKLINALPSAYSCLTKLPNKNVGILYETGQKNAYETIRFECFPLDELVIFK